MKILFVLNSFYSTGNGLSASARRTVLYLKKAGHDVRILSGPNHKEGGPQPDYPLKQFVFPIFNPLIVQNGYDFAQSDFPLMEEAAKWADVIHIEEPFVINNNMIKICHRLGKPVTGTYHLHPENITCNLGPLGKWSGLNRVILRSWRRLTYNHLSYVQCPTENVLDRLRRYHFTAKLVLISNGIVPDECIRPVTPPANYEDPNRPIKVIYVGRLANEKDQFTLMEAMRHSKYAKRIRLQFAGKGPMAKKMKRVAHKLYEDGIVGYDPEFYFMDRDGLRNLAAQADMCIHCAFIEVEGLSIMEAIQQAAMPIIAEGRYTGTSQFALSRKNIFPVKNPEALAHRIDYWIERPRERWESGFKHMENMKQYNIDKSVEALVQMFENAIKDNKQ